MLLRTLTRAQYIEIYSAPLLGSQHVSGGDQFAALSPISKEKEGIFSGRLAIWTEIDRSSNVIDKSELEEVSFSESGVDIPREIGFNSKVFSFSFRTYDHLLFVEIQNDEGKHLSINRARLAFGKILSSSPLKDIEEVIVHVIPVADSVDRVLSLPQIRKVEIRIHRPNPDELDDDVANILKELEEQGAGKQDVTLTRAPGIKTIVLNAKNKLLARAASFNGYVKAIGRDEVGEKSEVSTRDHPRIIEAVTDPETTPATQVRQIARGFPRLND